MWKCGRYVVGRYLPTASEYRAKKKKEKKEKKKKEDVHTTSERLREREVTTYHLRIEGHTPRDKVPNIFTPSRGLPACLPSPLHTKPSEK